MLQVFFQSMLIGYSGAVMPGSLLAYTIDKSILQGKKAGLLISIGHSLLEFIVVTLILLGAVHFLDTPAARTATGIIGGIVLLYLGISMLRSIPDLQTPADMPDKDTGMHGNLLLGGAVLSISNPYFTVWWVAIGLGLVTSAYAAFGLLGVAAFYTGHILADITWYVFISFVVSESRNFISTKVYKVIIAVLGLFLIAFGIRFLVFGLLAFV